MSDSNVPEKKLYAIIIKAHVSDRESVRPILQKISDTTSYLYLWTSEKAAKYFIEKNSLPMNNCEIVESTHEIIKKTIEDFSGQIKIEKKIV